MVPPSLHLLVPITIYSARTRANTFTHTRSTQKLAGGNQEPSILTRAPRPHLPESVIHLYPFALYAAVLFPPGPDICILILKVLIHEPLKPKGAYPEQPAALTWYMTCVRHG